MMRVRAMVGGVLVLGLLWPAAAGAVEPDAQAAGGVQSVRRGSELRGFSLVLVQGDMKAAAGGDALPAAAAKALADMKDFLPFKSYTLLDTAWTAGSSGTIKSQLRQSDTQTYDVELRASVFPAFVLPAGLVSTTSNGGGINISGFRMKRAGAGGRVGSGDTASLASELQAQEQRLASLRPRYAEVARLTSDSDRQAAAVIKAEIDNLTTSSARLRSTLEGAAAANALIDTSFRMALGETVVVGTSRQQGDKALIVIVTAVGRP
jgi:hypothetical protein